MSLTKVRIYQNAYPGGPTNDQNPHLSPPLNLALTSPVPSTSPYPQPCFNKISPRSPLSSAYGTTLSFKASPHVERLNCLWQAMMLLNLRISRNFTIQIAALLAMEVGVVNDGDDNLRRNEVCNVCAEGEW